MKGLPEEPVAQHESEHVKHGSPPRVNVRAERPDAHDGLAPGVPVGVDPPLLRIEHHVIELVPPQRMLVPQRIEIARKALVQPEMAPVPARHNVSPPLVSKFMRDKACRRLIHPCPCVVDCGIVRQRRGADILHPPLHKITDQDLGIFRPGVFIADLFAEPLHHVGCARKTGPCVARLFRVLKGDAARRVLQDGISAGGEADEIRSMRNVLPPVEGLRLLSPVLFHLHEPAVREGNIRATDSRDHFAGCHVVREIIAREPEMIVHVLPL